MINSERGSVLILALVLLVVGALILTPLLGLMGTGLLAGQLYERKTDELYAADAGVEDAIWKIQTNNLDFDPVTGWSQPWHITVNGKNVTVVSYRYDWDWTCGENFTYRILSTAAADDEGGAVDVGAPTTIDAHLVVSYMDFSALLDHAIVSNSTIDIQPNSYVDGDVWLPDNADIDGEENIDPEHTVYDFKHDGVSITWPTFGQLSTYYWDDVKHLDPYPLGYVLNIPPGTTQDSPYVVGPLLTEGDLTITGRGWIKLNGTIYVKGTLFTNPTPEIHINLEGNTIFAEDEIRLNPGNPGVWLHGSGCIIARHYIRFQPNLGSEGGNFVFVLSLEDKVWFNPGTDFTGCIAGDTHVQLQPGNQLSWISPEGKGLDFPMGLDDLDDLPPVTGLRIESWEINPQ